MFVYLHVKIRYTGAKISPDTGVASRAHLCVPVWCGGACWLWLPIDRAESQREPMLSQNSERNQATLAFDAFLVVATGPQHTRTATQCCALPACAACCTYVLPSTYYAPVPVLARLSLPCFYSLGREGAFALRCPTLALALFLCTHHASCM